MTRWLLYSFIALLCSCQPILLKAQNRTTNKDGQNVITGAEQLDKYLPMLDHKKVALLINQTSVVGKNKTLLLDTLLVRKVNVKKIFVPEHGFRGEAQAGEKVSDEKDPKTGLPVVSLYGKNKKPSKANMKNIDVLIYDLQDVGVRFYTYISTLQYAMEACAENGVELIVLDRPNPNGHYVDGPILDTATQRSFVGMQPIPIVYGMTAGEYAKMLVGEKWAGDLSGLKMTVIKCENYDHKTMYDLPVDPSPNLRSMAAIYAYPSLCLFEGTVVSVGRGTDKPFQHWGHPAFKGKSLYSFKPIPVWGQKVQPLYAYQECYGQIVAVTKEEALSFANRVRLMWLIRAYEWYPEKDKFFNNFFEKLAGTSELRKQIEKGMTEEQIQATWTDGIQAFKKIRKKYLLYNDFEG